MPRFPALQTMLSISTTLIKRHLQFAVAVSLPGWWTSKGVGASQAGNWHCQRFASASAAAASFAIKCMQRRRKSGMNDARVSDAAAVGVAVAFRPELLPPRHSKRNLKFSWLPFFEALSSLYVGDMAGWMPRWLGGWQDGRMARNAPRLPHWLTAARYTVRMSYAMTAWHRQQQ